MNGLAEDLFTAFKHSSTASAYMASLRRELMDAFDEYWDEHSGDYDHPEITYHQFVSYLPMELRMLHLEYAKLMHQAMTKHGHVSLINLTLLCPDDTIIATFKSNSS